MGSSPVYEWTRTEGRHPKVLPILPCVLAVYTVCKCMRHALKLWVEDTKAWGFFPSGGHCSGGWTSLHAPPRCCLLRRACCEYFMSLPESCVRKHDGEQKVSGPFLHEQSLDSMRLEHGASPWLLSEWMDCILTVYTASRRFRVTCAFCNIIFHILEYNGKYSLTF